MNKSPAVMKVAAGERSPHLQPARQQRAGECEESRPAINPAGYPVDPAKRLDTLNGRISALAEPDYTTRVEDMHIESLQSRLAVTDANMGILNAKMARLKRKRERLQNALILALIRKQVAPNR